MVTSTASGQWTQPVAGTGHSFGVVGILGWASATVLHAFSSPSTGGELLAADLQKYLAVPGSYDFSIIEATRLRTPQEDLTRIQEVLSPAVTNLAEAFGVTRQTIYNWRKGEAVAFQHAARLQDLAQASDVLVANGIVVTPALLKRKFAQGRTLLQVSQAGESARDAALMLATILTREEVQRARVKELFDRKPNRGATADFDLPHADLR